MPTKSNEPAAVAKEQMEPLTFYFITYDWSGLHDMFETGRWESLSGVPLVPMYWVRLAELGHSVHVFVSGNFKTEDDFSMKGIHIHRRRIPGWALSGVGQQQYRGYLKPAWFTNQYKAIKAVLRTAKEDPPDVIYSYHSGCVSVGYFTSRRLKVPHLVHLWGTWLAHYLLKEPWYKRLKVLGSIIALRLPIDLLIISNDGTEGDKAVKKLKFPLERFRFWLDGTSPDIPMPDLDKDAVKRSAGLAPDDKMIFQVARLDVWKRMDRSIGAMPDVVRRVPNAQLVIGGDGHLRKTLEQQAEQLGVRDHVKFLGMIPNTRVRELHNAADIFLTVQDLTNLGNQIMEALHSGTCTVAYDIGATKDVMVDGITGRLLPEAELPQLGEIIADLLLDDQLRDRLAKGAQEFAKKNIWFWEERIQTEIREVRTLVARNRQRHTSRSPKAGCDAPN